MGLFKNANESAYVGGRKHFTDVIKNTGSSEMLLWRQPEEDFNDNSTLVVMPGEVAIFIKGGNVEAVFQEGTYKLSSENYPFIGRLRNALSGGVSTFNCVVYFVKMSHGRELLWGTDSPIEVRDRVWNIVTDLRARGSYRVQVVEPVVFLQKLVGNNNPAFSQEELDDYFRNKFQSKIRSSIARVVQSFDHELIGMDAYLDDFSAMLEPVINEALAEYGIRCVAFAVAACDIDKSKYDILDSSQMDAIARQREAMGEKAFMDTLGDDWARYQTANILNNVATNPGTGGEFASMGAGFGVGAQVFGAFNNLPNTLNNGTILQNASAPAQQPVAQPQPQQSASSRFAPKEQTPAADAAAAEDPLETLGKLKKLLDAGLIEQSDYDAKKAEVLGRM